MVFSLPVAIHWTSSVLADACFAAEAASGVSGVRLEDPFLPKRIDCCVELVEMTTQTLFRYCIRILLCLPERSF
jgi:hypothetical protein